MEGTHHDFKEIKTLAGNVIKAQTYLHLSSHHPNL